jgi:hypothetical protein
MAEAPAAAAAEHLQPLGSKGQSPSWKRYKANALSIAWQMLLMMRQDQHPQLTRHPLPQNAAKFLDQTKEALLDPSTYELLATYLFLRGAQEGQRRLPDGDHGKELPELRAPVRV